MRQQPKPWTALGISRATWYRHGKPTDKPIRETQALYALQLGKSVRTIQRLMRIERACPELVNLIINRKITIGKAEQIVRGVIYLPSK
jgi:hypothetical protein